MVAGWTVFFGLVALSRSSIGDPWEGVRGLPLLVEGLVWLSLFPFVLALGVWESSWAGWLRLLLVVCFALGCSIASVPRERGSR